MMKPMAVLAGLMALAILLIPLTAVISGPAPRLSADSRSAVPAAIAPSESNEVSPSPNSRDTAPAQGDEGVYRGVPESFRILDETTGRVTEVSARDFVRGAVAAEMPALYHPEALKSQAVAAYTYAVRQAGRQRLYPEKALKGADFSADPQNLKVYLTQTQAEEFYGEDFDLYWNKVCAAADEAGQYLLLYEGEPAATAYHAISAGRTEAANQIWTGEELPYLIPVDSPGDELATGYQSTFTITATQLSAKLKAAYPGIVLPADQNQWVIPTQYSESGYVTQVALGNVVVTGLELRFLLELRSSHFQVSSAGGEFTFVVQGYGHGAGMSQNGADFMARQGATFDEILLHYYPDTTLALAAR